MPQKCKNNATGLIWEAMPQKTKEISIGSRKTSCIIFAISFASVLHFWPRFFFALFRRKSLFAIVYFFLRFFKFMIFWNKQ